MRKSLRLTAFIGAACATTALVAFAAQGTGAYFQSNSSGTISANSGALTLSTTDTNLSFANLMPGVDQTQDVNYSVNVSSGKVDLWLVFDQSSAGYQAWTGPKSNAFGGGLGRYGHFAVADNNNLAFQSYNLQLDPNDPVSGCTIGSDGRGNFADSSPTSLECGVPGAILLTTGLSDGDTGQVEFTYGLTGKQTQQNQTEPTVGYQIVATQAGQAPTNQ